MLFSTPIQKTKPPDGLSMCIAQNISTFFQLGIVTEITKTSSGLSSENYFFTSNEFIYVLRLLKQFDIQTIKNEICIQKQLKMVNISTSHLIPNKDNKYVYKGDNLIATVSRKIEGHHPIYISHAECFSIGLTLAKFHTSVTSMPHQKSHGFLSYSSVIEKVNKLVETNYKIKMQKLLSGLENFGNEINLPTGVIHSDLHRENILITHKNNNLIDVAILDMEHVTVGILLYDITRSICDICRVKDRIDSERVGSFLAGYSQIRFLEKNEKALLNEAISFSAAAVALWFYQNQYFDFADIFLQIGSQKLNIGNSQN